MGATRGAILGGQWLRTTGCTGHGAKGEGLLGWPEVPKRAGRSVHMGRLKEEAEAAGWGWGRSEPRGVQSGGGPQAWAKPHL